MNTLNRKRTIAAFAAAAALAFTGTALADHGRTVTVSGYAGSHAARYDYARVVSADPIVRYVTVRRPVQNCWNDVEYFTVNRPAPGVGAQTLAGAIVGGVIGHQFGSGRGNDAATVAGTLIGAAIANDSAHRRHGYVATQHSRPVRRCETVVREHREERIDGYRVTYRYNGQTYRTRMPYDPGRELRVRVDIRPSR